MLQRAAGAKARALLCNAGMHPVALYGGSYWGFSSSSITELRRQAIIAALPPARFRVPGLVFTFQVHGILDPAVACHQMPIVGWARVVWSGSISLDVLNRILDWAGERLGERQQPWRVCNGPAQAYLLSILRLGWTPKGADVVITDHGYTINFRLFPPLVIRREVAAAVRRWEWRRHSHALQEPSLAAGGFIEGVQDLLRKGPIPTMSFAGGGPSLRTEGAPPPGASLRTGAPTAECEDSSCES